MILVKLDNHGWGLNQMLIWCAILFFFLFLAIFSIIQLSKGLGDSLKESITDKITYSMVEENVENATYMYMEKYYQEEIGSGTITVTTDNLIKYDMIHNSSLKPTDENTACRGYALVKKENGSLDISSYISCSDYETKGYQSWRLGE